jgi:hypothetical protein
LTNEAASSRPRTGELGVLPVDELPEGSQEIPLRLAVVCPNCTNYGIIEGIGDHFANVTKMREPRFLCSQCSWGPRNASESPERWKVYYGGRLGGTLLWCANEEHIDALIEYLETNPKRRGKVQFGWEFGRLMQRLPTEITSGRFRNDVVSLLMKLRKTRPREMPVMRD